MASQLSSGMASMAESGTFDWGSMGGAACRTGCLGRAVVYLERGLGLRAASIKVVMLLRVGRSA